MQYAVSRYYTAPAVAPLLLIVLRLCQGLAVGGEFTTSIVLLVEGAQRSRRGYRAAEEKHPFHKAPIVCIKGRTTCLTNAG